jgi:phosphoribosylanthranilate isomerase
VRVEVKVCGLTRAADARAAAELGARYLGVVFAGGPRTLDAEAARRVLDGGGVNVDRVGVFGNVEAAPILRRSAPFRRHPVRASGLSYGSRGRSMRESFTHCGNPRTRSCSIPR